MPQPEKRTDSQILDDGQTIADQCRLIDADLTRIAAELQALRDSPKVDRLQFLEWQVLRLMAALEKEKIETAAFRDAHGAMSRKAEEYRLKWGQELRRREALEAKHGKDDKSDSNPAVDIVAAEASREE